MKKKLTNFALALGALTGACLLVTPVLAQQSGSTTPGQAADRAGQAIGSAADRAGQTINSAADRASQALYGTQQSRLSVTLPQGITAKNASGAEAIRDVFKAVTQTAVSGNLDSLRDQLAEGDRNRLTTFDDAMKQQLSSVLDPLRASWKTHFNSDFAIANEEQAFGPQFAYISQGEINDPSQVMGNWPLPATMQGAMGPQGQSMSQPGQTGQTGQTGQAGQAQGTQQMDRGRDVAVVVIPASASGHELTVSLVHEAPDYWKIDIPDNIDAQTLTTSLRQHLAQANTESARWGSDQQQGAQALARHVLEALYNVPVGGGQSGMSTTTGAAGAAGTAGTMGASDTSTTGTTGSSGTTGTTGGASGR